MHRNPGYANRRALKNFKWAGSVGHDHRHLHTNDMGVEGVPQQVLKQFDLMVDLSEI